MHALPRAGRRPEPARRLRDRAGARRAPVFDLDPHLVVLKCGNCGANYLDDEADERLSEALRVQAGLLSPDEVRKKREELSLAQRQLASLLRVAEFTLSRWETGSQIQSHSMDAFLRVFFRSAEARRILGPPEPDPGVAIPEAHHAANVSR